MFCTAIPLGPSQSWVQKITFNQGIFAKRIKRHKCNNFLHKAAGATEQKYMRKKIPSPSYGGQIKGELCSPLLGQPLHIRGGTRNRVAGIELSLLKRANPQEADTSEGGRLLGCGVVSWA